MAKDFGQQVADWVKKSEKRLRATARESTQQVLSIASTPRPLGRLRVRTGFLRASLTASLTGMPAGPSTNDQGTDYGSASTDGLPSNQVSGEPISTVLLRWQPNKGQPFFAGWTANYARAREYKDGFQRGAVERWDEIVDSNARRVKLRIK